MDDFRIVEAEAEVDRARGQLLDTVGEFADRLEPRKILNEMWDSAKEKSAGIAGECGRRGEEQTGCGDRDRGRAHDVLRPGTDQAGNRQYL